MLTDKIEAISEPTDIIVLPEMFSTGFTMNAAAFAETMDGPTLQWMQQIAIKKDCAITGSLIITEDRKFFNRLIWMMPNGHIHYDKRHLFSLAGEDKTYTAGQLQWIVSYRDWRIFPLICYDLRFPVWSRRNKKLDYDVLLYVANWPERRNFAWKQLLIARAIENQSYVVGVNRVGNDGHNVYHSGDSVVLDYKGTTLSALPTELEGHQTVILKKEELKEFRNHFAFGNDGDEFTLGA